MQKQTVNLENGVTAELYSFDVIIVGSGAAGLNCAERLHDAGITDLAILTTQLYGGTSCRSGSDKQTYYKMSLFGNASDNPTEMAHSLFDGGAMHGDLAYIESVLSLPAFFKLVDNGVPFPHNRYGAYVGYKTDHDPRQRATSAGPKTSFYMAEGALLKVKQKQIPIFDYTTVVRISVSEQDKKQVCGVIAIRKDSAETDCLGITLFSAGAVVLATGGPGELYAASVYPGGQVSLHGVALEAGVSLANLGESQFGITSTAFRWNLSGTYQQVLPSYFSLDSDGVKRNFLADYYRNTREMASNIFLKGYQWPFSAARSEAFGSSLIDIAVDAEIRAGRKVYLDFNENPSMNGEALDISKLIPEARQYLEKSGAVQATPYERLAWMNPASIDIYTENRIDLREPLEIAVSFQHNNGGIDVDYTYQTSIASLFAIGEIAGAHGVSRPGGAALNSGQVGGIRVVQYLKSKGVPALSEQNVLVRDAQWVLAQSRKMLSRDAYDHFKTRKELQQRMTNAAGFLRDPQKLGNAFEQAETLLKSIDSVGLSFPQQVFLSDSWDTRNLAIAHAAFLKSIEYYVNNGGGSRGSYLVVDKSDEGENTAKIESASGPLLIYRKESIEHRKQRINVSGQDLSIHIDEVRPIPEDDSWYETTWAEYRDGKLF